METALCGKTRFQINTLQVNGVITYLNVPPRVEVPVGVAEGAELWRDTTVVCESGLPAILMPLEKEINQRILLQSVVTGALDHV